MDKIIEILKEAQKGEGAYNRDQHIHANNVVDNMKELIGKAIEELEKEVNNLIN